MRNMRVDHLFRPGFYYSLDGSARAITRMVDLVARDEKSPVSGGNIVVFVAGTSGVGKSFFADYLSHDCFAFSAALEKQGDTDSVVLVNLDDYGFHHEGKFITDCLKLNSDLMPLSFAKKGAGSAEYRVIFVEGTSDNFLDELVPFVLGCLKPIMSVGCCVAASTPLFSDTMSAKYKDSAKWVIDPTWREHWLKKSKDVDSSFTENKARFYRDGLYDQLDYTFLAFNHSFAAVTTGWHKDLSLFNIKTISI